MPVHLYDQALTAVTLTDAGFLCRGETVPTCRWNGVTVHLLRDAVTVQTRGLRTMSCVAKHIKDVEVNRTSLQVSVAFNTDDGDRCSVFGRP